MPLTDSSIRSLKPQATAYKVADEKGLYLLVTPAGGRLWKLKFRNAQGTEKKLSLGRYPELSLKLAREKRDLARARLSEGIDPAEEKQQAKRAAQFDAENTFEAVAKAYIEKNKRDGLADATIRKREWLLSLVSKALGRRPVADIQPAEVLAAVRPFEAARNDEKAHRALQFVGQVLRYAVALQLAKSDPTRDLRGALSAPKPKHHAAILDPEGVGALLRSMDGYDGMPITKIALQLSAILFVRPGELRRAEWSEIDLEKKVWRIPAPKMKGRLGGDGERDVAAQLLWL